MFCSVGLGGLTGHEVDEGLEGHNARVVGVHQGHDTCKLHLTLSAKATISNRYCANQSVNPYSLHLNYAQVVVQVKPMSA